MSTVYCDAGAFAPNGQPFVKFMMSAQRVEDLYRAFDAEVAGRDIYVRSYGVRSGGAGAILSVRWAPQ